MNKPVNLEIAKLLKEKGFDEWTKLCVADDDDRALPFDVGNSLHKNSLHPYYSAPTICEVLMWMYEKHGIWIEVTYNNVFFKANIVNTLLQRNETYRKENAYKSPTEAYEAAIVYCLKNLI
jgi:hypothetical protein